MNKAANLRERLRRYEDELARSRAQWRWGETRRFQSSSRKLARRAWLIDHISCIKVELRRLEKEPEGPEQIGR
ncbi:MAG: hypothetical protein HYT87_12945 [Nitrospirae bacterium]|nr:hypothetical protein [Nitrospirota bacterium]